VYFPVAYATSRLFGTWQQQREHRKQLVLRVKEVIQDPSLHLIWELSKGVGSYLKDAAPLFDWSRAPTDAATGVIFYKLLGGFSFRQMGIQRKFRDIAPSDLCHPGRFSSSRLPARQEIYATTQEKILIAEHGIRYGCHSCGTRRASAWIADHQPPNSLNSALRRTAQLFYAHCDSCSRLQVM